MKKLFALLLALALLPAVPAVAEGAGQAVLFEDSVTVSGAWQLAATAMTVNAGGEFDPSSIREDSYFTVEYLGKPGMVYLALADWESEVWAQINVPAKCDNDGEVQIATFTYDQCVKQFGSDDFSDVDAISVGTSNARDDTTILKIVWHGLALPDSMEGVEAETIIRSSAKSNAANSQMAFAFTKHVGGEFDAAKINEGSQFFVEYSGKKDGVYLAFSSHSGANHWVRVNPSSTVEMDEGRYVSWFDYDSFSKSWGTNFTRLDQLSVFSAASQEVKLHRVGYVPGTGDPADTTDGRWDRPDTGIAFIGDSICQNAQLIYGDWNKILGRSDCCNFGIGGQTTVHCLARIDELASRDFHTVVFLCGINDIGWGYTNKQIVDNYAGMVAAIREQNPDCQFILISVHPTTEAFYKGQQGKIVALNEAYKAFAEQTEGVTFVDTYSRFTAEAGQYAYPELLSDGLHPNEKGYEVIAEVLNQVLPAE